jgi:RluA family pseudouridine synthase
MAKLMHIELPTGEQVPILYEDRSVLAIDKPRGWRLFPFARKNVNGDLQGFLTASVAAGDFWARSRNLKFVRHLHRLDADTTGVLLLAKSLGAVRPYSELFESRKLAKAYLAVVSGMPQQTEWTCRLKLSREPNPEGRIRVDPAHGREAETRFRVIQRGQNTSLLLCFPLTGRTHQIRVHLARSAHPIVGDELYAPVPDGEPEHLALRSILLGYKDPFTGRRVEIRAPVAHFVREYGFEPLAEGVLRLPGEEPSPHGQGASRAVPEGRQKN